jgi:hypothetical protein
MTTPLANLFSYIEKKKREAKDFFSNPDAASEQAGDEIFRRIKEFNKKDSKTQIDSLLNYVTPAGLGTITKALPQLKGMPGVHPNYDPEAAEKFLSKGLDISSADLWNNFGVQIDKAGTLKTNVSDKGTKLNKIPGDPEASQKFFQALVHPNEATLKEASKLLEEANVQFVNNIDAYGRYNRPTNTIKINLPRIKDAADADIYEASGLLLPDKLVSVALHEGTHVVQKGQGTARALPRVEVPSIAEYQSLLNSAFRKKPTASPEELSNIASRIGYFRSVGEQEPRAVQRIHNMLTQHPELDEFSLVPDQFQLPKLMQILAP